MSVREQLATQLGPVFFSDLRAHLDRQAVFLVRADVELLDVAEALASDDHGRVKAWLEAGALRRPTDAERASWASEVGRRFAAVPVQPFVLVAEEASPS